MPRLARVDVGGEVYHVINRANGRMQIFNTKEEYLLFERLMGEAKELTGMRILAYVLMPNHWHLVLYPKKDGDLGIFMHWLTNAHTRHVHTRTKTVGSGHLYQGRYKSFLVDTDNYLLALIKYVERNPVRAKLVRYCENWQWGSAWRRINGSKQQMKLLNPSPVVFPHGYTHWINTPDNEDGLAVLRVSVNKGVPYGKERWVDRMVTKHHLESTLRSAGRPKKQ
ncbi:MAG: transposase [bacterium]|nr:transposase [bacterium]